MCGLSGWWTRSQPASPRPPSSWCDRAGADDEALVYWAAIHQRLRRSEFGTALAEMDAVLAEAGEAEEDWSGSDGADSRYSHCRQPWHRWRTGRPSDIVGWANINSRPLRWPYADRR